VTTTIAETALASAGRDARLLERLCEPLEPRRAPFYVQGAMNGGPDGWYWVAPGADRAQYLGRNVIYAQQKLVTLLRDAQPT
jgi:hypothetical protein